MSEARRDVEFFVDDVHFETFVEAASFAVLRGLHCGQSVLDVLVWSEEGARLFAGGDGVERYREDPEASVFERIVIKAESLGRIP